MIGVMITIGGLGLCLGCLVRQGWRRWRRGLPPGASVAISRETLALQAFAHGNRRLAAGRFDEARAAFQQVLVLNPRHPEVAGRLAAMERQRSSTRVVR